MNSSIDSASFSGKLSSADTKKFETAISEKQELDAKVSQLEAKLKYTQEALNDLKSKIKIN